MKLLPLFFILLVPGGAILQNLVWNNTAFSPLSAASNTTIPNVDLTLTNVDYWFSQRITGTIVSPVDDLITFSVQTDGSVRMWVDDHLIVDSSTTISSLRVVTAALNISFFKGKTQDFRIEYLHYPAVNSTLILSWSGNTTAFSVVPETAFSNVIPVYEQIRVQLRDKLMNPPIQWQTFNNPTMGTHVLMPQSLAIDVTLGDLKSGNKLGNIIVFRDANPAITFIGAHSLNGSDYTNVQLDKWLGYDCTILLETTVVNNGADLLYLATSNGTDCKNLVLYLSFSFLWERKGSFLQTSNTSIQAVSFGFDTRVDVFPVGTFVSFPGMGLFNFALSLDPNGSNSSQCGYTTGSARSVPEISSAVAAASARQAAALTKWGNLTDVYVPQVTIIAWNTMYTPYEGVITPVSRGWSFGSGYANYVLFDWDGFFLVYMASLEEESLDIAISNLIQNCLMRTIEGFVPNFAAGFSVSYDRTEPQIGAYVALQVYNKWGDEKLGWVVDRIIDSLFEWNTWVWNRRRGEGSLATGDGNADLIVLGSDPNKSPVKVDGGVNTLAAAILESGQDNSAMYDTEFNGEQIPVSFDNITTHHMSLYDVGMTSLFISDTQALIELATKRNRPEMLPVLQERQDRVTLALQTYMWDGSHNLFTNVLYNGSFYPRYSPTTFFPLISGIATPEQATAAMTAAASPTGFCFNSSYTPDENAEMLVQWWDGKHDNAACVTDACTIDQVNNHYGFVRIEAVVLTPSAPNVPGLVPLYTWYSASRDDHAMTTTLAPPDSEGGYVLQRQEGFCFESPPTSPLHWPSTELSSWFSASRKDYQVCGSPNCLKDVQQSGYQFVSNLCFAYNGTGPENMPCKFGGCSISRNDPAFFDNSYWRGRIWGPHLALIYWGLKNPAYATIPEVEFVRKELVKQSRRLLGQEWTNFRQVTENYNGIIGVGEDVANADPFYTWGALAGFVSFLEEGLY
jgi:putative isomerase